MTPQDFIAKWGAPAGVPGPAYALNEEQGAQSHFLDLCELLDVPKPGSAAGYLFEEKSRIIGGKTGYADVSLRGVFAWENKAPGKNLDAALKQLLSYSLALANPPLLVVSDRLTIRIHTQFTGHPSQTHTIGIEELDQPEQRALLRRIWTAPESFKPRQTNRDITEAAARSFATLAEGLRQRGAGDANAVAHFLTQCLFCFFAEDVGLLPGRMFERLVTNAHIAPLRLGKGLEQLFAAMQNGGLFGADDIPWFNGGLFQKIAVPALTAPDVLELRRAAQLNWSAIDVSIFGTLFERGLDPAKRSQLGAHYTDPATIERIIDPVIRRPLLRQWQAVVQEIKTLAAPVRKKGDKHYRAAHACFVQWLDTLKNYRALDPACGSGNFLFLALKCLKDIEHHSHLEATALGLEREADLVTGPHNVLGIELNEYAAELARVTVWIGELQWRLAHGYEFKTNPVLEALEHIECRDALLCFGGLVQVGPLGGDAGQEGSGPRAHKPSAPKSPLTPTPPTPLSAGGCTGTVVVEAAWPAANVVIGNPPFLGGSKKRGELGDAYFEALKTVYDQRVPSGADLVCYWFDKARAQISTGQLQRAGLVTTNSIRGGANRKVLEAIGVDSQIFEAWSDEPWVNNGAAVRVSLVCFGDVPGAMLNGVEVHSIHPDLTASSAEGASTNLTTAAVLTETVGTCFMGASKKAPFDIDGATARSWLTLPNPHSQSNAQVVRPLCNGIDLNRRWGDRWIVDFGTQMSEAEASLFEAPFAYVNAVVKPIASKNSDKQVAKHWWRHARPRVDMRAALAGIPRFIITAAVAKHRIFVWMHSAVLADQATLAIARADDTTLGILHSRFHELWSLRMGTSLEDRPRYTPTTCFETFPFPAGLTPQDTAHQRTEALDGGALIPAGLAEPSLRAHACAIAQAAQCLDHLRQGWLNPPQWTQRLPEVVPLGLAQSPYPDRILPLPTFEKELAQRTLTKLYNQRPAWLAAAHTQLDAAVAAAYGWTDYTPEMPDEEILRRLLALNLERSSTTTATGR